MVRFGNSKKDEANVGGGFGLPNLSLGKSEKAIGLGLGKASNTLKNTGEKVEDFLWGHSKKKNSESEANLDANIGFGLPNLSLGGTEDAIGQGLKQTGDTIQKSGKKVENFLFGHSKKQKNTNVPSVGADIGNGFGLPGISLGKAETSVGQGLGELSNIGEKVVDPLFGHKHKDKNDVSIGLPNVGGVSINVGNQSGRSGSLNLNTGHNTFEGATSGLLGTGDIIFPTEKTHKSGFNLGFAGTGLSDVGKKVNEDITKIGNKVEKTGGKVIDYFFGKGKPTASGGVDKGLPTTATLPNVSWNISNGNEVLPKREGTIDKINGLVGFGTTGLSDVGKKVNEDVEKIGNKVEKTGGKVIDYLLGKGKPTASGGVDIGLPSTATLANVSWNVSNGNNAVPKSEGTVDKINGIVGLGTTGLSDVGKKMNEDVNKIGNKVEQTGRRVIDSFGKGKIANGGNTTISNNDTTIPQAGSILQENLGGVSNNTESTHPEEPNQNFTTSSGSTTKILDEQNGKHVFDALEKPVNFPENNNVDDRTSHEENGTLSAQTSVLDVPGNTSDIGNTTISYDTLLPATQNGTTLGEISTSSEVTETQDGDIHEIITGSPTNSLEESAIGLFGASEVPPKTKKSEETLKKIEDILKGSGTDNTTEQTGTKGQTLTGKPNLNPNKLPEFTYTNEVTNQDSTTPRLKIKFHTSVQKEVINSTTPVSQPSGPVKLHPYYVVPNNNSTIGEENIPSLPPSVFDKPTGDKAPFIPILPPMESSTGNLNVLSPAGVTLTPYSISPTPTRNMTPVEYGAIGVGSVLMFALIAYIYQKYKQYTTSSSGGSYSPKTQHKKPPGRRRSTKSNESEEGQSSQPNEIYRSTTTENRPTGTNSEVVVVDITSEIKANDEVVETPIIKTLVNNLQKSSPTENRENGTTPEHSDSFEVISETQKATSMEKPPRRTKTPSGTPEKFTSDKTSASNMNEDSLKTVTHAIGGILRSQVPNTNKTEDQPANQHSDQEEDGTSIEDKEVIGLLGKLCEPASKLASTKDHGDIGNPNTELNTDNEQEKEITEGEPLYRSIDKETDAGSEYFSADENNDHTPQSSLKEDHKTNSNRPLRAEDVYNAEIITEDGRKRSIEEDIAECILDEGKVNILSDDIASSSNQITHGGESLKPSAPQLPPEDYPATPTYYNTNHDCSRTEINQKANPKEIQMQNLINEEKNSQQFLRLEAEVIIDDIIRASQLDALTIQSIKQDLGTSGIQISEVRWSDDDRVITNSDACPKTVGCDLDAHTWTKKPFEERPSVLNSSAETYASSEVTVMEDKTFSGVESILGEEARDSEEKNASNEETEDKLVDELDHLRLEEDHPVVNKNLPSQDSPNSCMTECSAGRNSDSTDNAHQMEYRFEFIPPRQPHLLEDDLIVFSNSDQESISPLSHSTTDFNSLNDEPSTSKVDNQTNQIHYEAKEEIKTLSNTSKDPDSVDGVENEGRRTKWYVPDDEIIDTDLRNIENKSDDGLYIVLSEDTSKSLPEEKTLQTTTSIAYPELNAKGSSRKSKRDAKTHSNISYAFLEVYDDPAYETWPEHLPKNIHSLSGVSLAKVTDNGASLYDVLKEEPEVLPSTSGQENNSAKETQSTPSNDNTSSLKQKPIPKFMIPNMDARKKRMSRRRQIKSLDSGVHHYYGEYLNLVEFPEIENEDATMKEDGKEKVGEIIEEVLTVKPDGGIIEEVITVKPDGAITHEKIVIE